MKQRVHCEDCENFIHIIQEDENNMFSKVVQKAKCKLGKRVMFRNPTFQRSSCYVPDNDYGYIRYCNDFKQIKP